MDEPVIVNYLEVSGNIDFPDPSSQIGLLESIKRMIGQGMAVDVVVPMKVDRLPDKMEERGLMVRLYTAWNAVINTHLAPDFIVEVERNPKQGKGMEAIVHIEPIGPIPEIILSPR